MKRTERHHLKSNELASTVQRATETLSRYRRQLTWGLGLVALVLLSVAGYTVWRERNNRQAAAMLADALAVMQARVVAPAEGSATPAPEVGTYPSDRARREAALPKFMAAAEAHPDTQMGIAARYHAAALLASLGRTEEAETRYAEVIERAQGKLYGEMARMGRAEVQATAGKYDEAIATWQGLAGSPTGDVPVDAVLVQLARTCEMAGKRDEARKAYQRVIEEFSESPYVPDARQALEALDAKK